MRVFIADDSTAVRERLITMLSELEGIEIVGQAGNAVEATDSILKLKPDVAILDIQMPGGSGIYVLRKIKKAKAAAMVIVLTNYPYPQYRETCLNAGADFFFDKSTEFSQIVPVLRRYMTT